MNVAALTAVASVETATAHTGIERPARKKSSPCSWRRDATPPITTTTPRYTATTSQSISVNMEDGA